MGQAGSGSESSFIKIPGNVKQSMLPFVLDPNSAINQVVTSSVDLAGASPQKFSFRQSTFSNSADNYTAGLINICPSSFRQYMSNDVSYQLLFNRLPSNKGELGKDSVTVDDIFKNIPGIQIREYLPDTALNQIINMVTGMMNAIEKVSPAIKDAIDAKTNKNTSKELKEGDTAAGKTDDFVDKLFKAGKWIIKYLTGGVEDNFIKSVEPKIAESGAAENYTKANSMLKNSILNLPYVMYYRFLSSATTNIYELPCQLEGNTLYSSNGNAGWDSGSIDLLVGPLKGNEFLKTLLGNVRMHYLRTWDAEEGSKTQGDTLTIHLDLYNDTEAAAITNFIFVNTLIPNNRWIQYNMFEHAPALYDIKIEGYNRLFACSGNFKVTYKGMLREIPMTMAAKLCSKHLGKNCSLTPEKIIKDKLIKIPDIYSVDMQFQSCLPENFNTWLFMYSQNTSPMETYAKKAYDPSIVTDVVGTAISAFGEKFSNYWKNNNFPEK